MNRKKANEGTNEGTCMYTFCKDLHGYQAINKDAFFLPPLSQLCWSIHALRNSVAAAAAALKFSSAKFCLCCCLATEWRVKAAADAKLEGVRPSNVVHEIGGKKSSELGREARQNEWVSEWVSEWEFRENKQGPLLPPCRITTRRW